MRFLNVGLVGNTRSLSSSAASASRSRPRSSSARARPRCAFPLAGFSLTEIGVAGQRLRGAPEAAHGIGRVEADLRRPRIELERSVVSRERRRIVALGRQDTPRL